MSNPVLQYKLSHVRGLQEIVSEEIAQYPELKIVDTREDLVYLEHTEHVDSIKQLRSIKRAFLVARHNKYNPSYVAKHKSLVSRLVDEVVAQSPKGSFASYVIHCAGADSPEIQELEAYLEERYKLPKSKDPDLKIYIVKIDTLWEIGVQITPRPLSQRAYRVRHMNGAMEPTIAYALNHACRVETYESYLNIFSGSATLMIEAAQCFPKLQKIMGFDNNKEHLSLSIQNIKQAGLIRRVQVQEADIHSKPPLGTFDVITSDLPFGMAVARGENLRELYRAYIEYAEASLHTNGVLGVYTSEFDLLEDVVAHSNFAIRQEFKLYIMTAEAQYLPVKLLILNLSSDN